MNPFVCGFAACLIVGTMECLIGDWLNGAIFGFLALSFGFLIIADQRGTR